jgi:amidase
VEPFTRELSGYFYKFLLMAPGALRHLRNDLVQSYKSLVSKYDVVLSPTLANPTPKLKYFSPELGVISLVTRLNNNVSFTTIQNATGAPAISLPMGVCSNGMPIGLQFAAALGEERKLLELAFELEAAGAFSKPVQ